MNDIRQSLQFSGFMKEMGWNCVSIKGCRVYLKKFPLMGYFAKIPRFHSGIDQQIIKGINKKFRVFRLNISPDMQTLHDNYADLKSTLLKFGFTVNPSPFNPTTTIQIKLDQEENSLFETFSSAKRRAVRKAIKNGVIVRETNRIDEFIRIRQKQYFPLGFLITREMFTLWKYFYPKYASLLMAYKRNIPLAGILLLFCENTAYYWYASSLKQGKKLFAPTLLVFEALKLSKKKGCKIFDFEGIYDNRFPKASESWRGFTKFKEGFGGEKIVMCENFSL